MVNDQQGARETVTPKPGQSMTDAICQKYDPDYGRGLSWLDVLALREREDKLEQEEANRNAEF